MNETFNRFNESMHLLGFYLVGDPPKDKHDIIRFSGNRSVSVVGKIGHPGNQCWYAERYGNVLCGGAHAHMRKFGTPAAAARAAITEWGS